jgi:hypothetical protein
MHLVITDQIPILDQSLLLAVDMAGQELMIHDLGMEQMVAVAVVAGHREEVLVLDYNLLQHQVVLEIMVGLVAVVTGLQGEVVLQEQLAIPFLVLAVATAVLENNTV